MDYFNKKASIPRISYKSAFLIFGATITGAVIVPSLFLLVGISNPLLNSIIAAFCCSLSVTFSIFIVELNEGINTKFRVTFISLFCLVAVVAYFGYTGQFL